MMTHAWSNFKSNININYDQYNRSAIAVLAGVSQSHGLDHMMIFDFSVNNEKFKIFLDELRAKFFFDDICIYMDNLTVHTSKVIKERMDELGFAYVYSPVYSPQFNGVEEVFAMAKREIKRRRLQAIIDNEDVNLN